VSLTVKTDRALIRAGSSSTRYVLARLVAPRAAPRDDRLAVHVALVLDRSGSMAGESKFPLAREAAERALALLRSTDQFALVTYDERVDVLAELSPATPAAKRRALDALRTIEPRGSTDLASGWLRGCEQVAGAAGDVAVSRCLLLTDGLANQGMTDRDELALHAGELRARSVATSTFGVGADFDERLLRDMGRQGGGNFYFVERAAQIPDLLTSELGEALEITVRGASLDVTLPEGADCETLNRFRCARLGGGTTRIELGDLVSEQEITVVLKVSFPPGAVGDTRSVLLVPRGDGIEASVPSGRLTWTRATHEENDLQPRDREVDREVAELYAARARAEATEANRRGDLSAARRVLESTAARIRGYAGSDAALRGIVASLQADIPDMAERAMSAMQLKQAFFAAEMPLASRAPSGSAKR
jgi:Ca-activated chloride channel family protein